MLDVDQEAHHVTRKPRKLCYKSSAGRNHSVGVIKPSGFCRGFEAGNHAPNFHPEMAVGLVQLLHHRCLPVCHRLAEPPH